MAGITDIRFLTRPVRGYAGGDLVINPPTAAEELGISTNPITTFRPGEYLKNLTKGADLAGASEQANQFAVDQVTNQLAEELKSQGYKIDIDLKGIKNWIMGKNPDGSSKLKAGKLPKDWAKQNRKQLGQLLDKIPASSARRFFLSSLIKSGIKFSSPITETIQGYLDRSEQVTKQIQQGKEVDEVIVRIDPDLIKTMTAKDLQKYMKDTHNVNISDREIYKKINKFDLPVIRKMDFELTSKLQKAFDEIGDKDFFKNMTKEELWNTPQIQKIADEGFLTEETIDSLRIKLGYPIKKSLTKYFDRLGADHGEIVKYMEKNNVRTEDLIKKFPKLQKAVDEGEVSRNNITQWRKRLGLQHKITPLEKSAAKLKIAEAKKLKGKLHLPSSKDVKNVSPVIKDAIEKELARGQVEAYHPAMVKHRGDVSGIGDDVITLQNYLTKGHKEAVYAIGPSLRNKLQNEFEEWIPTVTAKKNKLISQFKNNKISKDDFLGSLEKINNDLNLAKADMEKLGLMSKLFNPRTGRKEYFGKPYNNTLDLIKDIRNEYNLFSEVGKKHGMLGGKEKIPGLKKEKHNQGGMVGISQLTRPLRNFSS